MLSLAYEIEQVVHVDLIFIIRVNTAVCFFFIVLLLGWIHLNLHGLFASLWVRDEVLFVCDGIRRRSLGHDRRLHRHASLSLLWSFWLRRLLRWLRLLFLLSFLLFFLLLFKCLLLSFLLLFLFSSLVFVALIEHLAHHVDCLVFLIRVTLGISRSIRLLFLRFFVLWLLLFWLLLFWLFLFWFFLLWLFLCWFLIFGLWSIELLALLIDRWLTHVRSALILWLLFFWFFFKLLILRFGLFLLLFLFLFSLLLLLAILVDHRIGDVWCALIRL